MNLIKNIEINNFRSIQHVNLTCSGYNLFCGLNDMGKSNILKALNLFFNNETDFKKPLDFTSDYNKVSLARAQKSDKQKQLIKIKVTFNIPKGYKSLSALEDFYIEKVFDRYGNLETRYSNDNSTQRTSKIKIFNRIKYIYIPALKGEDVIQYLLGLLGEYELIENQAIEDLNKQINNSTHDLSNLLKSSKIGTGAYFGLPTLLSDFWQKLSVNTTYDQFNVLEQVVTGTVKDKTRKLNSTNFQVPLTLRGEGIKSKYIPPLLQWLQQKNNRDFYIWGIDEPENSLEFRAAEALSNLFCNDYAPCTQIFGTTHSMAFINPPENAKEKPKVFRCFKSDTGATNIKSMEDLLKDIDKQELLDEIGALNVQKQFIQEYREKMAQIEKEKHSIEEAAKILENQIANLTKPFVITEGKTDWKHLKAAFKKLNINMPEFDFLEYEDEPKMGDTQLENMCKHLSNIKNTKRIICIFDNDNKNIIDVHGKNKFKTWGNNVYSFCIPIPKNRSKYKKISIEFYYSDDEIRTIDPETGKRLYFTNEIEEVVKKSMTIKNLHSCEIKILPSPSKKEETEKRIFDTDIVKNLPNAHSKSVFAENVFKEKDGFSNFNVSNFNLIFDVIKDILTTQYVEPS